MRCVILYHLYNLKNLKNTHGGVLLLVKLQAKSCDFSKSSTPPWVLPRFLNCTNGTKSRKAFHISYNEASIMSKFIQYHFQYQCALSICGVSVAHLEGAFCKNSSRQKGVDVFSQKVTS